MSENVVSPIELDPIDNEVLGGAPLVKRNLSLLGHVNVHLDVLIGSASVTVEKLFSLAKGDAIALDTDLDGPVTIQLDGKAVALGYLVAAGDHFGIKISEIL